MFDSAQMRPYAVLQHNVFAFRAVSPLLYFDVARYQAMNAVETDIDIDHITV